MQDQLSESKSARKNVTRRVWFWILIGVVLVGTLFFIMLPVGIDYGIEHYLKNQGADEVTLEDVDYNPFTRRLTLNGMGVKIGPQTTLKIPEATFIIQWSAFFKKRFVLVSFDISDSELVVKELSDGRWQIGGINLPDQKETSEPSSWNFGLQQVTVKNSTIKFISSRLSADLKIEQAKISKLHSWLPERKARLEFLGQLNESKLQIQADLSPFGDDATAAGSIKLKGLSLTPFAPLLKPHLKSLEGRVDADLNIETRQMSDTGFSHTQKGALKLHQVRIQIEDANFSNESLAWDGSVRIDIPKSTESLKIAADGRLNGTQLAMASQNENLQIQQEDLTWAGKVDFDQTAGAANLKADSVLTLQNTKVSAPDLKLAEEKLNWKGTAELSFSEKVGEQRINANGNLSGGPLTVTLPQAKLKLTHSGLDWQGKVDYAQEQTGKNISADGQMRLASVKMESPEANLTEEELTWKGALQLSVPSDAGGQRVIAEGTIDGNNLQADLPYRKLKLGHRGLSWKGRLDSGEKNDFSSLKATADFSLNDIKILQSETGQHLFNLDQADFQAIQIEGLNKITVSAIALKGLAVLAELNSAPPTGADPSLLGMQALEFKEILLSQQKDLAIESIDLKAMKVLVHRDSHGKLPAIERLKDIQGDVSSTDQSKPVTSDTKTKGKPGDFKFRIAQLEITGDSKLRIKDESVSPAYSIDLSLLEVRLADLDNRRPQKPATLKLLISDGKHTRVSLDGTMQPFGEQVNLNWTGKIESFELPPISPYVIQNTGYRFVSGELQADIPVKVSQNQLKGEIDLVLYNPRVERVQAQGSSDDKQGKIQIGMPLDSALRLMRDEQNDVRLKIPISGDIRDPKFSIADAINKVLAQALQKSSVSYLKYMLGPYGIGISVAEFAYNQATKIRLNPILFKPGSDELDESAIDYTQRVAAILKEHPTVRLSVCGVATESDRAFQKETSAPAATDATLLELARNRTESIETQLIKLHGIAAKRIIACESQIDSSPGAKPRADLDI